MESIKVKENTIKYILERKRIKNCYISIKDGNVVVRVPNRISQKEIDEIILQKSDWIFKNIKKQQKELPKQYINGEMFRVLGKDVKLNISYENKATLRFWLGNFYVTIPIQKREFSSVIAKKLIDNFYKELAEKEIEKSMRKMAMTVGLAPKSYKIKNLKSTWGNCSTTCNISINRNIVMYSRKAIEYVCLHEICHLRYMNHSKDFWAMVAKFMPDYKIAEEELRN